MSTFHDYEIPKSEEEIHKCLDTLKEHSRYNQEVQQKAEEKIARYTKDVADAVARKNAIRSQITEAEQKIRKLQASLLETDAAVKASEAKLNQYMETKERVTNRMYNIRDINAKLNGALKTRAKPSKIQFPADKFSDDERE